MEKNKETKIKRYCLQCGKLIKKESNRNWNEYKKKRFCSRACCGLYKKNKIKIKCFNCGKELLRHKSHILKKVFCSRECRTEYAKEIKICIGCGDKFWVGGANGKSKDVKYCSIQCIKSSSKNEVICIICNKKFMMYNSEIKKHAERNHVFCCSRDCRNKYTSLLLGGDGTWIEGGKYNFKRQRGNIWRKIRNKYINLSGYVCESCGEKAIEVHHLMPIALGGDLIDFDNLMSVCNDCHKIFHSDLLEGRFDDCIREYSIAVNS